MDDIPGVDYSEGRPGGKALAAAGVRFAARYLSTNDGKNLHLAEATDLAAHGVSCVVVWETTAQRAADGRAAGITDAQRAAAQAKTCGQPSGRPIYFAVDWDASPSVVVSYFQGVASVIGLARTGVYGGYKVVKYLLDHKLATWAWQTVAWSQGHWDPRAHIRQYASTVRIGGVSCDHDTAMTSDYGQWTPGRSPLTEDDMTPAQEAKLDQLLALAKGPGNQGYRNPAADAASVKAGHGHIPDVYGYEVGTYNGVQQLLAKVGGLSAALSALTVKGGLSAAEITAAAEAGAQAALAELGDALTPDTKEN